MRQVIAILAGIAAGLIVARHAHAAGGVTAFDLNKRRAEHWSWQPVRVVPPPEVKNAKWVADPIDQFVLGKLEAKGLSPASPAAKRTLIRRAYFDITGLPPTSEQVEAFLADASPTAFAKVVDGLLASPHYGERWARHWLDLVRFAETYGHEEDYPIISASQYLYYVVRALNADVPYDRFVVEHLAGDLLPDPRINPETKFNESIIATGFWFLHEQTHSPVDSLQHYADRIDNQIDVFGKTFQAATLACARCHDHKFDAMSTRDYYALYGVLQSTREQQAYLDPSARIAAAAEQLRAARKAGTEAISAAPHSARPTPDYSASAARFEGFDAPGYANWFVTGNAFGDGPTREGEWDSQRRGAHLAMPGVAHSGMLAPQLCGTLRSKSFVIDKPFIDYLIKGQKGQVRLVVDGYAMNVFNVLLFEGFIFPVDTVGAFKWHRQDVSRYKGHSAYIEIIDDAQDGYVAVDEIVFADGSSPTPAVPAEPAVASSLESSAELKTAAARLDELAKTVPAPMRVLAAADGNGVDSKVFRRGSHLTPGENVPRRYLEAIDGPNQPPLGEGSGRLEIARRIASAGNPRTSRVMVNRVWQHLMGRGIVPTVDDFGVMGELPSHPELLDHLADRFVRDGWSTKRLIRSIMLSSTYQMGAEPDAQAMQIDPQNLLLHHRPLRRLEGEAIRDAILAISGRLDQTVAPPIVDAYLTDFMTGRNRPASGGPLDGEGRRSLYTRVRRNFLPPMMLAFDTPIPFGTVGRRGATNVPAQALILMNDPFVVEQARVWANAMLKEPGLSSEQRIDRMHRKAFARPATEREVQDGIAFLNGEARELGVAGIDEPRLWADYAHVLFNLKEFVFVN